MLGFERAQRRKSVCDMAPFERVGFENPETIRGAGRYADASLRPFDKVLPDFVAVAGGTPLAAAAVLGALVRLFVPGGTGKTRQPRSA